MCAEAALMRVDTFEPTVSSVLDLGRRVEEAQARVIATVDASHAEYVAAFDQLPELRSTVARLCSDLSAASTQLEADMLESGCVGAQMRTDVEAFARTMSVLETILGSQKKLEELDRLINSGQYSSSAGLSAEIAQVLQGVSAAGASTNPVLLRAAKMQYYQRRAILTMRLEEALCRLCSFGERSTTARRSTVGIVGDSSESLRSDEPVAFVTLFQVWEALNILSLRNRKVELVADEAVRRVLQPLFDAAKQLPALRRLKPRVFSPCQDAVCWTWADTSDEARGEGRSVESCATGMNLVGAGRVSVHVILPALESLLIFAYEHWAGSVAEVYAMLGRKFWPLITRSLLQHFDTCGRDGGQALERFELTMFAKGFIDGAEKTLSRHVHSHRCGNGDLRRASTLAEARAWLLRNDATVVTVSDEDVPESISHLAPRKETPLDVSDLSNIAPAMSDHVKARLQRGLKDDEGFLRLSRMCVSSSSHKLVCCFRQQMEAVVVAIEQGHVETARDLNKLCRELCNLFALLRPRELKSELRRSPKCGAVFLCDCLYLVHVLTLTPYAHSSRLPREHHHLSVFVDFVPRLRHLGINHFRVTMTLQQEEVAALLQPCSFDSATMAQDRTFLVAEKAIGASMAQVKRVVQELSAALPEQLLRESTGQLLGVVCRTLLGKLFQVEHIAPAHLGGVCTLFTSARGLGQQVLLVAHMVTDEHRVPCATVACDDGTRWNALTLVSEMLGAGLLDFVERRFVLAQVLSKEEAVKLMRYSGISNTERANEILRVG